MQPKGKSPDDGARYPPYSPDKWITEIPFDVAEWGDKDVSKYGDPFPTEEIFQQALRDARKLPKLPKDER